MYLKKECIFDFYMTTKEWDEYNMNKMANNICIPVI